MNQTIVIVPGHQQVEFDADTNTKTVTERTTTGYQQTITIVSDEGLVKTLVKTFFNPVEIAGEETIEEEEETYEEVIETTEPTTRTTTTKTTTGRSDLVEQQQQQQNTSQSSQDKQTTQVISARELPKSTITKRQIGEEEVRYETVVSEDGKTTTTRKIVTTPGEEIEIVEYEEQEVTEPRELKVVTTTKTIPTLANIRSERSHSQSVEVVEEHQHTTSTSQRTVNKQQQLEKQSKKQVETQFKTETNVSQDGRDVETVEYEEQHVTEPAVAPKTTTKTTTIPAKSTMKMTTEETVNKSTLKQQQMAKRTEDTVAQIPENAVVTTTLPDGQEVQVETSLSEDGKTKLLTKTVRQPEEDVEVEDYEESRTTVPRTRTTKSNNTVVSVEHRDDEEQNTIKTDKTRTRANKMASETILVDAQTDRPIGQHQQVATSLETSNVTGLATTTVDAQRGAVTSNVAASETNTKTLKQEEVTVMPNETKKSTKSETHTESRTITSSQTSSGSQRQQRDSLTDTNLAAIRQKQQAITSVDKSVTAAVENKTQTEATNQMITKHQKQSDVQTRSQQELTTNKSDKTNQSTIASKIPTTTNTNTQQQQKKQLEEQLKLTTMDKKITNHAVSTITDAQTGDVTTEEIRHFDGGREHIYTTVHSDGTMKMSSKTFFDSVPLPATVGAEVHNMKQQQLQNNTSNDRSTQQQQQKSQLEGQIKLTSANKKFTSQIVSTTTDPQTREVTTEEVRHFDGGREHIYTTVRTDGTMEMSSKTFFDTVASSDETTTTTTTESAEELSKKKLRHAVSSKQTVAGDVSQPIPPPRKKEVKPVPHPTKNSK